MFTQQRKCGPRPPPNVDQVIGSPDAFGGSLVIRSLRTDVYNRSELDQNEQQTGKRAD